MGVWLPDHLLFCSPLAFCVVTLVCFFPMHSHVKTRTVTCNAGYTGGGKVMCGPNGTFGLPACKVMCGLPACNANSCSPTEVSNSDYADVGSITGVTGQVSHSVASV